MITSPFQLYRKFSILWEWDFPTIFLLQKLFKLVCLPISKNIHLVIFGSGYFQHSHVHQLQLHRCLMMLGFTPHLCLPQLIGNIQFIFHIFILPFFKHSEMTYCQQLGTQKTWESQTFQAALLSHSCIFPIILGDPMSPSTTGLEAYHYLLKIGYDKDELTKILQAPEQRSHIICIEFQSEQTPVIMHMEEDSDKLWMNKPSMLDYCIFQT